MFWSLCLALFCTPQQAEVTDHKIEIVGAEELSTREMRKAAVDEESDLVKNGYRRAEVDDMAFQMEMYALAQGYPQARVRWSTEVKDGTLIATFTVKEGPYCTIAEVDIEGAQVFAKEELAKFFYPSSFQVGDDAPAYVESRAKGAGGGIASLYRGSGYRDVEVSEIEVRFDDDRTQAFLSCTVTEGPQFLIQGIDFTGFTVLDDATLWALADPLLLTPYFPRRAFELKQGIEDRYADLGYASAKVDVARQINEENGEVDFEATVLEGPRVRIREVIVEGNERTRSSFIRNRLELRPDDWSNRTLEEESFRNLYRTGLFTRVGVELEGEGAERDLRVAVEEGFHKEFIIEPGYGSYEKLRLLLGWRNKNIFGSGRILRAETRPTMKSLSALVGVTDPWLFESDVELDAPVFFRRREEPSFTREEAGVAFQFRYPFNTETSLLWGYRITRSRVSSESAGVPPDILIGDTTLASVFVGPRLDTQNDYFNPTQGGQYWFQVELGADALGSQVEFAKVEFKLSHHWPLTDEESTVLAVGLRSAAIEPIQSTEEIPLQLRLFNGGENSVRAFTESRLGPLDAARQPIGGEVSNTANIELRQRMNGALWGGLFVDAGNVSLSRDEWFDDVRTGAGIGLRYLLPVGALRLDWGYNLDKRAGEDSSVLHLSVGMAF